MYCYHCNQNKAETETPVAFLSFHTHKYICGNNYGIRTQQMYLLNNFFFNQIHFVLL